MSSRSVEGAGGGGGTGRGPVVIDLGDLPSGGVTAGGAKVTVCYDDLNSAAWSVTSAAGMVADAEFDVLTLPPKLPLLGTVASLSTTAQVHKDIAGLLVGPRSLSFMIVQLTLHASSLHVAANTYRVAEITAGQIADRVQIAEGGWAAIKVIGEVASHPKHIFDGKTWMTAAAHNPDLVDGAVAFVHQQMQMVVPATFEEHVGLFVMAGRAVGHFRDDRPLTVGAGVSRTARPSTTIGDLIRSDAAVEKMGRTDHSNVRVHHIVRPDGTGAWIIDIPGTQNWETMYPQNPSDASANLIGMAGQRSSIYLAIDQAMRTSMARAGVKPGTQPVMIVGHSQGGILATQLSADKEFRRTYDVRQVVTAGSPVSKMAVPSTVKTFDIDHSHDIVPRLDGADSPTNKRNRVGLTAAPTPRPGDDKGMTTTHPATRYADTADRLASRSSNDINVQQFYSDNDTFLDGTARDDTYDYTLRRPQS